MTITIDDEAAQAIRSPLDWERTGQRFKTDNDLFTMPDPNRTTVDLNLFYLLKNATEVPFEHQYNYRPDYVSFDYYGTTVLANVILYVNSIRIPEEFVELDVLLIPAFDAIITMLQDNFPEEKSEDLDSIDW
jgi:hypothetical protein